MHTVIILNKHSSDLLKDFRFLFKPFVDEGIISFCDWNESGTEIKMATPDLYELIKGKQEWRAVVVGTESMYEQVQTPAPDEKNPFDFSKSSPPEEIPRESSIPMVRLAHMICGYPLSVVKNFEKGFEYYDEEQDKRIRVRKSELADEAYYRLSDTYGDKLKSIYMEEKLPDEVRKAQEALAAQYSFADIRPREMIFISTRKHCEEEAHIYESWKNQIEMESSNFSTRNRYPNCCRFLCYSITNAENSRYMKELIEFWLSVLTVVINKIPASTLQAYRLYQVGIEISKEKMELLLNQHLNKMESAYEFIQTRLNMRPEYSFDQEADLIEVQEVPVIFEETSGKKLHIHAEQIGLSRDCPEDELMFWNREILEKQREIDRYLKTPRRAIDKASQYLKEKSERFYGEEYELDKFQVSDLEEDLISLEQEVLTCDTRSIVDEQKIKSEIQDLNKEVRKEIAVRMRKGLVIKVGVMALLVYLCGFLPYLVQALQLGVRQFQISLILVVGAVLLVGMGGMIVLFAMRYRMLQSMERFNSLTQHLVNNVNASAKKFERYFSVVCSYMKAQAIRAGTNLKSDSVSSARSILRAHKQALMASIQRDKELAASYGIKRNAEVEGNITLFFDEKKLPKDNRLYYFEIDKSDSGIPVNRSGDLVQTPYGFVGKLKIEREDIYDEEKGER